MCLPALMCWVAHHMACDLSLWIRICLLLISEDPAGLNQKCAPLKSLCLNTLQILLHMLGSQHISDKTYSLPRTHFSTSSIYKPLFPLSLFISRYMYIHIVHIFFPKFLFKNFLSVEKLRPRTKTICTILTETHHLVISHHTLSSTFC